MLQASPTYSTSSGSPVTATGPLGTALDLLAVTQGEAGRLPGGWFKPILIQDEDEVAGLRQDFVLLDRMGGAPVGSFSVHQVSSGRFDAYKHPEDDSLDSPHSVGQFPSIREALDGIMIDITTTLSTWSVRLAA